MVRAVALVFGVSFLAVGVLGFILNPTGGERLGIFAVNVLHNLVHLLFGIFGIAAVLVDRPDLRPAPRHPSCGHSRRRTWQC